MFVMVTGGSGSGKSAYAEERIVQFGGSRRFYIAAMRCVDEESRQRAARHRQMRGGKGFDTIERYEDLESLVLPEDGSGGAGPDVLLECMSNLTANEMFGSAAGSGNAGSRIKAGIDSLLKQCDNLVVVTNEVFSDGVVYAKETRQYMELLGEVNRYMAALADEVVEVVCGIPLIHKRKSAGKAP